MTSSVEMPPEQKLPTPKGFKVLCAVPKVEKTYESGIVKADNTLQREEVSSVVLFVVSMGPEAYKNKEKFTEGAFCAVGDFVIVRAYSGTRFKIGEQEFRLVNDDQIEAVVDDPRGITRV